MQMYGKMQQITQNTKTAWQNTANYSKTWHTTTQHHDKTKQIVSQQILKQHSKILHKRRESKQFCKSIGKCESTQV